MRHPCGRWRQAEAGGEAFALRGRTAPPGLQATVQRASREASKGGLSLIHI